MAVARAAFSSPAVHRLGHEDDVDVADVVQLPATALAHGDHGQPARLGAVGQLGPGQRQRGLEGGPGQVGELCRRRPPATPPPARSRAASRQQARAGRPPAGRRHRRRAGARDVGVGAFGSACDGGQQQRCAAARGRGARCRPAPASAPGAAPGGRPAPCWLPSTASSRSRSSLVAVQRRRPGPPARRPARPPPAGPARAGRGRGRGPTRRTSRKPGRSASAASAGSDSSRPALVTSAKPSRASCPASVAVRPESVTDRP